MCLASSSRLPPRAQSLNQTSASISSGLSQAIPARHRAAADASGKGARSGTQALASRKTVDRAAYLILPCSARTNAHGALANVAKLEPVAMFDATASFARPSTAARLISDFSTSGLNSLYGSKSSAAKTSHRISLGGRLA